MNILVTGGAGYIGSFVTARLLADGHDVTVLDSLVTGDPRAAAPAPLIEGDVADRPLVAELLRTRRIEAVVHLAARKSVVESVREPALYFRENVAGTVSLLEAMVDAGCDRLVFSSTCAVYGNPPSSPIDETTPIAPLNPYGESKAMAEQVIASIARAHAIHWVTLRYFNAAGAASDGRRGESWTDAHNLIPAALRVAAGLDRQLNVFGTDYPTSDGTAIRDYVHVEDLADAHAGSLAYLAAGGASTTLGLGTGRGHSVRDVVRTVEAVTGEPLPICEVGRRNGDPAALWADASKARATIGWTAERSLLDMVRSAWHWHTSPGYGPPPPSR